MMALIFFLSKKDFKVQISFYLVATLCAGQGADALHDKTMAVIFGAGGPAP